MAHSDDDASWRVQNSFVEVNSGSYKQSYREFDVLSMTKTGVLDSENGSIGTSGLRLQLQSNEGTWVQANIIRSAGETNYDGHIQAGSTLTPVKGVTGNVLQQGDISIGYALNSSRTSLLNSNWQVIPLIQWGRRTWRRDLTQYKEQYTFDVHGIGTVVQWRPHPGTLAEFQYIGGSTTAAHVTVDSYGFDTFQPGSEYSSTQLSITQDLHKLTDSDLVHGWSGVIRYTNTQYKQGQSPVVKGLQAPPSDTNTVLISIGIQRHF